jgi:hypothetical protein
MTPVAASSGSRGEEGQASGRTGLRAVPFVLVVAALLAAFGPSLVAHARRSADPAFFNDDVRAQVYPFLRYERAGSFRNDYPGDYFFDCRFPAGYRLLYTAAGKLGAVEAVSKALPYVLLLVTFAGVGLVAHRFGGWPAAAVAVALCLGSDIYLACTVGGVSHAFGFPISVATMLAVVRDRPGWLAALTIAGAAFYPTVGVVAGICLVLTLVVPTGPRERSSGLSWSRRAALILGAAAVSAILLLPPALGARPYGPLITLATADRFPEAGPGGRYHGDDRPPFKGFVRTGLRDLEDTMSPAGPALVPPLHDWIMAGPSGRRLRLALAALLMLAGVGWLRRAAESAEARRLLLFPLAGLLGYWAARLVYPYLYLPQRYSLNVLPPLAAVVLASGASGLLPRGRLSERWRRTLGCAPGVAALLLFGSWGSRVEGLDIEADPKSPPYAFIAGLPDSALLAGWPSGAIDNVPWVSRRRALVTFETHQAQHVAATLEMRRRAEAVIDAFFATDPEPLQRLKADFGVTHFVVDLDLAAHPDRARYFAPFDRRIASHFERTRGRTLEIVRQLENSVVFRGRDLAVLDLSRLPPR